MCMVACALWHACCMLEAQPAAGARVHACMRGRQCGHCADGLVCRLVRAPDQATPVASEEGDGSDGAAGAAAAAQEDAELAAAGYGGVPSCMPGKDASLHGDRGPQSLRPTQHAQWPEQVAGKESRATSGLSGFSGVETKGDTCAAATGASRSRRRRRRPRLRRPRRAARRAAGASSTAVTPSTSSSACTSCSSTGAQLLSAVCLDGRLPSALLGPACSWFRPSRLVGLHACMRHTCSHRKDAPCKAAWKRGLYRR